MRILLTNDDGIHSPGLWSAAKTLRQVGEVFVVAPDRDQSGVGTMMTLSNVVRANETISPVEGVKAHTVEGTPADCVILATESLFDEPFDLVVSGINQGANMGVDIIASGTVGAAFHGYWRGIPSIAVSVAALADVQYEAASHTAKALASAISANSLPEPMLLNVNLPNVTPDRVGRVELTTIGPALYRESVERGHDGRRTHYWIKADRQVDIEVEEGTDIWAVSNNRISITPLDTAISSLPSSPFKVLSEEVEAELSLEQR